MFVGPHVALAVPQPEDFDEISDWYTDADFVRKMDVRIGDSIVVYKSGEIIPKVGGGYMQLRPENSVPFRFPDTCPVCGEKVVHEAAEARCINPSCSAHLERTIINF